MRRAAVVLVLCVLGSACSANDDGSAGEIAPAETPVVTIADDLDSSAMGQYLSLVERDGDSVGTALVNFAMHFGSIEGVDAPAYDDTVPVTASDTLMGIERHWEELSESRRRAVGQRFAEWIGSEPELLEATTIGDDEELGLGDGGIQPIAYSAEPDVETADDAERELWRRLARDAADWLRTVLPDSDNLDYHLFFVRPDGGPIGASTKPGLAAAAEANLIDYLRREFGIGLPELAPNTCLIFLSNIRTNPVAASQDSAIAHEMFHCWSLRNLGIRGHIRTPVWVQEGLASWVGETYAGGSPYSDPWWRFYLRSASGEGRWSTFPRTYDAIGLWSALDMLGGDLFAAIPNLMTTASSGDDQGTFAAATDPLSPQGYAALAATAARKNTWGPSWSLVGPGIVGSGRQPGAVSLGPFEQAVWTANLAQQTNRTYVIEPGPTWAAVTVQISGPGQIRWANGAELVSAPTLSASYCIAGPCVCSDGQPPSIDLDPYSGDPTIAVATAGTARETTLASVAVADEANMCEPTECPAPAAGSEVLAESVAGAGAPATGAPAATASSSGPDEGECAPCPAGTWEADAADAEEYFKLVYDIAGVTTTYNGGRMVVTFAADFSFSQVIESVDMSTNIDGDTVQRIFDSSATGFWGVIEGQLVLKFESIVDEVTTIINGTSGNPTRTELGPEQLVLTIPFEAECTDTTLRLATGGPRGVPDHWTKIS